MFLQLKHTRLEVFQISRQFVLECYKLTKLFPPEEKFGMTSQIRRAALSVHLNIAEGSSRTSEIERKRFYEIARGSIIEVDAALDIGEELKYFREEDWMNLGDLTIKSFKMVSGLIDAKRKQ